MSAFVHLFWVSTKGLFILAVVTSAMIGGMWLAFGLDPKTSEAIPGIIGGGLLLFVLVFGGIYIAYGGNP